MAVTSKSRRPWSSATLRPTAILWLHFVSDEPMLDIPGVDTRCRVLTRTCYRGKWPGFRTVPGSPVPYRTPVKGLFNVGDASCPRGFAGSMGAATSAMLVRDDLRKPA